MTFNVQLSNLLKAEWMMNIPKQINKLLDKMSIPPLDADALEQKVSELTDNARDVLIQAVKNAEVDKIVGILGIEPITYMKRSD